jgi:hypothetical protein
MLKVGRTERVACNRIASSKWCNAARLLIARHLPQEVRRYRA